MSSTDDYYLAVTALDNGADDFIHKPPNPDELRARLRLADRVTSMKQQLIRFASIDCLTGLLNRRAFFDTGAEYRALDPNKALSVVMFDIDHFKRINDTYGHEMGDYVLAAVGDKAKMMDGATGRLGGEEFCMLANGDVDDALDCAGELQRSIRAMRFNRGGVELTITCSFGVAEWEQEESLDAVLRRADMAMYEAKKSGRDRIVASDAFVLTSDHHEWRGTARTDGRRQHEKRR
jgi:diguanylate cyclase (GGDEF)-like protein